MTTPRKKAPETKSTRRKVRWTRDAKTGIRIYFPTEPSMIGEDRIKAAVEKVFASKQTGKK